MHEVYMANKGTISTISAASYLSQSPWASQSLPPCRELLRDHINRANYVAAVWKKADTPIIKAQPPTSHGWQLNEGYDGYMRCKQLCVDVRKQVAGVVIVHAGMPNFPVENSVAVLNAETSLPKRKWTQQPPIAAQRLKMTDE